MTTPIEVQVQLVTDAILEDYAKERVIDKMDDLFNQPDKEQIISVLDKLIKIVYPGYFRDRSYKVYNPTTNVTLLIEDAMYHLNKQIAIALKFHPSYKELPLEQIFFDAQQICVEFFGKIPKVREYLETDIQAAFDGDPAAKNYDEIILAYPGLYAITVNRLAHELFLLEVPMIPRIMTEHAHSLTGIDIHPGATIGRYFFIDHGTGIVVGETTTIGEHVKLYQGVTLGALSTRAGQGLRGKKRHPNIEDNVTIYSGASILGGETTIGEGAVIGGNAFITSSIEAGSRVSIKNQELQIQNHNQKKEIIAGSEIEDKE